MNSHVIKTRKGGKRQENHAPRLCGDELQDNPKENDHDRSEDHNSSANRLYSSVVGSRMGL